MEKWENLKKWKETAECWEEMEEIKLTVNFKFLYVNT